MDQPTFADLEYQGKKRKTRRELFLGRMDTLIPWELLEERIHPFYHKAGRGRHPYLLSVMLSVHCVQLIYNLSDPGMEDLLYESDLVRQFVGLKLSDPLPDETTILNFRHLLERHKLGEIFWRRSTPTWSPRDCGSGRGRSWTPPSSWRRPFTKNHTGERALEMHQARKSGIRNCRAVWRVSGEIGHFDSLPLNGGTPLPGKETGGISG